MDELLDQIEIPASTNKKKEEEEEPTEINIEDLKNRALKEVKQQKKIAQYEKDMLRDSKSEVPQSSHNLIYCTKTFMEYYNSKLCDNMVIATLFYVSSSLWLENGDDLDDSEYAEQEKINADSMRILSSLYCQLLLSPLSANLRVREERVFYETLIFFLNMCACFATKIESPNAVYELLGKVFRKGLQDPHSRKRTEFLPITEIVRRHWLSQRVPGKTRAEIKHSTLQGTADLIRPMCEKELPPSQRGMQATTDIWERNGFPKGTDIPINAKAIPIEMIIDMSPKQVDMQASQVETRTATPH
ncbi:hypothetical protein TRFO_13087 [Tritrichomonas foetus]|uniref:Uncharacterized protein n=1 Tax=Tritrichomonas foetus TaxID=1144522 RepID=A0A1J4L3X4_9EUKA|nr:hypothetical protein TRFO_13087 [Tritrichomonas foetus]|eukprot:OHT16654.1 hypothetical protein TRFO_13087 [Tritrichomonas foetus]